MSLARSLDAESAVVTFEPHPRIAMGRAEGMRLLTTVQERALLLGRYGVDHVVVAHFDEAFRSQSFEQFVRESLVAKLGMVGMVVGYNHRFGCGSQGRYESLQPVAGELGFEVECVAQHTDAGDKVSSTVVRNLIAAGDAKRAVAMLGHPYIIIGMACERVVTIDDDVKQLPCDGIYPAVVNGIATEIAIDNRTIILAARYDGRVVIEL
jgi:riboflavin kinase/FMN adenylyltransferase